MLTLAPPSRKLTSDTEQQKAHPEAETMSVVAPSALQPSEQRSAIDTLPIS
jgi:hypothetical protein